MPTYVIQNQLARAGRPGRSGGRGRTVPTAEVDTWLAEVRALHIESIICLLSDGELLLYDQLPAGLIEYYRSAGFTVEHVGAEDYRDPALSEDHLQRIWAAYQALPKPVLVHCSAGCDRTGLAVRDIQKKLALVESASNPQTE